MRPRWRAARSTTARISFTPAVTAESASKCARTSSASSRAIVVFPLPGGPQRISDGNAPARVSARSPALGASSCGWPIISSSWRGRMRSASGAAGAPRSLRSLGNSSSDDSSGGMRKA